MLVWLAMWTTVFFVHSANALPGIAAFGVALFRRPPFADEVSEGEFKRGMLALILGYIALASLAVWLFFTTYSDSPRYIQLLWYLWVAVVTAACVAWFVKGRRRIL